MGLPTTWFFLCLVHLFWVDHATAHLDLERRLFCRYRVAICGDDLVAHWPRSVVDRYHRVMEKCHVQLSASKHFVLQSAGVFTEKCFRVQTRAIKASSDTDAIWARAKLPSGNKFRIGVQNS